MDKSIICQQSAIFHLKQEEPIIQRWNFGLGRVRAGQGFMNSNDLVILEIWSAPGSWDTVWPRLGIEFETRVVSLGTSRFYYEVPSIDPWELVKSIHRRIKKFSISPWFPFWFWDRFSIFFQRTNNFWNTRISIWIKSTRLDPVWWFISWRWRYPTKVRLEKMSLTRDVVKVDGQNRRSIDSTEDRFDTWPSIFGLILHFFVNKASFDDIF